MVLNDSKKPRKEGLTSIVDRFQVLDKENFEALCGYIDIVKIHNVIPVIIPETVLEYEPVNVLTLPHM